jgi:hypothetical protein
MSLKEGRLFPQPCFNTQVEIIIQFAALFPVFRLNRFDLFERKGAAGNTGFSAVF